MPKGSIYLLVGMDFDKFPKIKSSLEFMKLLAMEENVFTFPTECFYYPGYLRIVLTAPESLLIEASKRLKIFCAKHYHE
jgi:tyrosine aminotransferase